MKTTKIIIVLLFSILWICCATMLFSQTPQRILVIQAQNSEPYNSFYSGFLDELREQGFIQGMNLELTFYNMAGNINFINRVADGEDVSDYSCILVNGTLALRGAKEQWLDHPDIDIFYGCVTDPIGEGVVENFTSPPAHNVTGVSYPAPVEVRLRILQTIFPEARRIGLIFGDMAQSHSYNSWLEEAVAQPEFEGMEFVDVMIPFIPGDNGTRRMAMLAVHEAEEIEDQVDIFLAPNDQMGIHPIYAQELSNALDKPVIALSDQDIIQHRGAVFAVAPDVEGAGRRLAQMVSTYLRDADLSTIQPEWSAYNTYISSDEVERLGISIPLEVLEMENTIIVE